MRSRFFWKTSTQCSWTYWILHPAQVHTYSKWEKTVMHIRKFRVILQQKIPCWKRLMDQATSGDGMDKTNHIDRTVKCDMCTVWIFLVTTPQSCRMSTNQYCYVSPHWCLHRAGATSSRDIRSWFSGLWKRRCQSNDLDDVDRWSFLRVPPEVDARYQYIWAGCTGWTACFLAFLLRCSKARAYRLWWESGQQVWGNFGHWLSLIDAPDIIH